MLRYFHTLRRGSSVFLKLLQYKINKKPFPLCVHIQITKRCNLQCVYCYADPQNLSNVPDMTYPEYCALLDELVSMGTRWIRFLGGEPLIRDDIGEMVDYARARGMITEMNTNGYFMKQKAKDIKSLDSLVVSIDGIRETNDLCRGKGSYDKAIEAIEIAKDLGISVRLHGCLSKYHTQKDIDHVARLAVEYGTAFNFSAPSPVYFKDDRRMEGHPGQEQAAMLHQRCVELKKEGWPLTNTDTAAAYVKRWPNPNSDVLRKEDFKKMPVPAGSYVPCSAGKLYCTVDVDGHVYACASMWKYGLNYKEAGFEKGWEYIQDMDCISCNYMANIELNLLLGLNWQTLFEVGSYLLNRTAKNAQKKKLLQKIRCKGL